VTPENRISVHPGEVLREEFFEPLGHHPGLLDDLAGCPDLALARSEKKLARIGST
jgi:hypothetical protein